MQSQRLLTPLVKWIQCLRFLFPHQLGTKNLKKLILHRAVSIISVNANKQLYSYDRWFFPGNGGEIKFYKKIGDDLK